MCLSVQSSVSGPSTAAVPALPPAPAPLKLSLTPKQLKDFRATEWGSLLRTLEQLTNDQLPVASLEAALEAGIAEHLPDGTSQLLAA